MYLYIHIYVYRTPGNCLKTQTICSTGPLLVTLQSVQLPCILWATAKGARITAILAQAIKASRLV